MATNVPLVVKIQGHLQPFGTFPIIVPGSDIRVYDSITWLSILFSRFPVVILWWGTLFKILCNLLNQFRFSDVVSVRAFVKFRGLLFLHKLEFHTVYELFSGILLVFHGELHVVC